ncbi:MAG: nicotinate-nucleotide--dimethylbenzimidazole phosphoribosyltransferase [Methanobacteriota archaeon]|nr:MAG: nicotinate-nucleotide--dimethylbenzimidazole phosphoribosyltransferase [Euryarchaeota archaeon]
MRPIEDYVSRMSGADSGAMNAAKRLQDTLTKPQGSLGKLEDISIRLAGIYGVPRPSIGRKAVFTMAADHGVTAEGVSAYPQEVTRQMVLNFASGGAAINVLSRHVGAEVKVVDMGVATSEDWPEGIVNRKVGMGTEDMAKGPAMTVDEAKTCLEVGAELAAQSIQDGVNALAIGDMGIGNTTAASAITATVSGRAPSEVTGRGTGIDDSRLRTKVSVIESALRVNAPDPSDGLDVLSKVGGFEIGGMAGVLIGAASSRVPVFLDGFVTSSAALIASVICPESVDFMIASHLSIEPGHEYALAHLDLEPVLNLHMRLGEGTGAVLALDIADASCKVLAEMATFDGAGVSGECE